MPQNRKKGTTPPIWVSQNFLTSYKIINRIIRRTTLNKDDHVIEIGPGKGHITGILIQKCRKVSAIEIDGRLYNRLTAKFKDVKNIRIYHQDFMKWKLPQSEDYKVFSNIPFCFTTDIMRKLTECKNAPSEAWLTMEKGAAKRFMGKPSESLRSLLIKPRFDLVVQPVGEAARAEPFGGGRRCFLGRVQAKNAGAWAVEHGPSVRGAALAALARDPLGALLRLGGGALGRVADSNGCQSGAALADVGGCHVLSPSRFLP